MRRPMERAAAPLRLMGAHLDTLDGRPPVRLRGGVGLHGIDYPLQVASAQVKSAVLLVAPRKRNIALGVNTTKGFRGLA